MTTRIIIARHGNTFKAGEEPRRVGARTDLPLVEEKRGRSVGKYLKKEGLIPDVVFAAPLKRTMQTASLAVEELGVNLTVNEDDSFTEIDYGPDEDKTEPEVAVRQGKLRALDRGDDIDLMSEEQLIEVGNEVLDAWNETATVPYGWDIDVDDIIKAWFTLANLASHKYKDKNVMVVSSNGIIRFSPYITGDFDEFAKEHEIKVTTGGVCIFEKEENDEHWTCKLWNEKPYKMFD